MAVPVHPTNVIFVYRKGRATECDMHTLKVALGINCNPIGAIRISARQQNLWHLMADQEAHMT